MLPNLGPTELIIILVIVLIIFGAGRLPGVFRAVGEGIREFREASKEPPESQSKKPPAEISEPAAEPMPEPVASEEPKAS